VLKHPQALGFGARPRPTPGRRYGLGALATDRTATRQTTTTFTGPVVGVTGQCTQDGKMIYDWTPDGVGYWRRKGATEVCITAAAPNATTTVHNADGSSTTTYPDGHTETTTPVTEMSCGTPPADGISVNMIPLPSMELGDQPIPIVLSATENTPITYYLTCGQSGGLLGLTRAQRSILLKFISQSTTGYWTDNGTIPSSSVIAGWNVGDISQAKIAGRRPLFSFKTPDGDTKDVYVQMGFDQGTNTFNLFWKHQKTAFQVIDDFVKSVTPIDPDPLLCQLLPVATKVPNPYVAAGSIVLQLSGKCDQKCPPGMMFDAAAKTCSCPPGLVPDPVKLTCVSPGAVTIDYSKWVMPAVIFGGAALLIYKLNKKKATTP
jgi:hypothetical protein